MSVSKSAVSLQTNPILACSFRSSGHCVLLVASSWPWRGSTRTFRWQRCHCQTPTWTSGVDSSSRKNKTIWSPNSVPKVNCQRREQELYKWPWPAKVPLDYRKQSTVDHHKFDQWDTHLSQKWLVAVGTDVCFLSPIFHFFYKSKSLRCSRLVTWDCSEGQCAAHVKSELPGCMNRLNRPWCSNICELSP